MERNLNIPWALLAHYFSGECAAADAAKAEQWLTENQGHSDIIAQFRKSLEWNGKPVTDGAEFKSGVRAKISANVNGAGGVGNGVTAIEDRGRYSRWSLPRWFGYYSVAAVAIAIAAWQAVRRGSDERGTNRHTTYITRAGQRVSINLANGSRVTLGPATTLRVQKTGDNTATAVEVTGEALFNVVHSAASPFTVTAHGVTARVLGTEFIVRAYDASRIRVAVRDGRVAVQSPVFTANNAAIVTAGEVATASAESLPVVTPIADIATDFAWASGELVLRDVPLGEALVRLSRWYGIDFRVTDPSLMGAHIDGTFPDAFRQADIKALAVAIKANAVRSSNTITFSRSHP